MIGPVGLLLLLSLQQADPLFSGPHSWSFKLQAPSIDAPPFSFDPEVDSGPWSLTCDECMVTLPDPFYVLILGHKTRAAGILDDMDYRCALVISRDKKNGWLIDRLENTAVRVDSQQLPEWCSE